MVIILIKCPKCNQEHDVEYEYNEPILCPKCKNKFTVYKKNKTIFTCIENKNFKIIRRL